MGTALVERDQRQVEALWKQAAHKHTTRVGLPEHEASQIEPDGVFTRLRRSSVPMKEGAVFEARPGRERSKLVEGVDVDEPVEGSLRYVARRTALGDFGRHLYAPATQQGRRPGR